MHFGGRGEGAATKAVVKFRCGLGVTRFRSALALYTVFVMFTSAFRLRSCQRPEGFAQRAVVGL